MKNIRYRKLNLSLFSLIYIYQICDNNQLSYVYVPFNMFLSYRSKYCLCPKEKKTNVKCDLRKLRMTF